VKSRCTNGAHEAAFFVGTSATDLLAPAELRHIGVELVGRMTYELARRQCPPKTPPGHSR